MKSKTMAKVLLVLCTVGFGINALSFLLMPVENLVPVPGILFWVGLVLGIVPQFFISGARKKETTKIRRYLPGFLTFFSGPLAAVADGMMIVCFAATVITLLVTRGYGYICFVLIAVTVFGFNMHCVLNGKNYRWVTDRTGTVRTPKEKQAKKTEKEREHDV